MSDTPEFDLSPVIGEAATEVVVGQYKLQFAFGPYNFAVQSPVDLLRNGAVVAHWEKGTWPQAGFYEIMNTNVKRCELLDEKLIVFEFANGIEMRLVDDSDQVESVQITVAGSR